MGSWGHELYLHQKKTVSKMGITGQNFHSDPLKKFSIGGIGVHISRTHVAYMANVIYVRFYHLNHLISAVLVLFSCLNLNVTLIDFSKF